MPHFAPAEAEPAARDRDELRAALRQPLPERTQLAIELARHRPSLPRRKLLLLEAGQRSSSNANHTSRGLQRDSLLTISSILSEDPPEQQQQQQVRGASREWRPRILLDHEGRSWPGPDPAMVPDFTAIKQVPPPPDQPALRPSTGSVLGKGPGEDGSEHGEALRAAREENGRLRELVEEELYHVHYARTQLGAFVDTVRDSLAPRGRLLQRSMEDEEEAEEREREEEEEEQSERRAIRRSTKHPEVLLLRSDGPVGRTGKKSQQTRLVVGPPPNATQTRGIHQLLGQQDAHRNLHDFDEGKYTALVGSYMRIQNHWQTLL